MKLMCKSSAFIGLIGIAASACASSGSGASSSTSHAESVSEDVSFPGDEITCSEQEGRPYYLSLESADEPVSRDQIGLEGDIFLSERRPTRMDLCVNDDTLKFTPKRVITWVNSGGAGAWSFPRTRILVADSTEPESSIERAMTENDQSVIHLEFKNEANPGRSFLLKGWKLADGRNVVTLSPFDARSGNPLKVASEGETVDVGILVEGDPFVPKEDCHTKSFTAEGLELSYHFCKWGSHGTRINYRFDRVSIRDTSPELATVIDFVADGVDADRVVEVRGTHHSLTDEFTIRAEGAQYRIKSGALIVKHGEHPEKSYPLTCSRVYECGEEGD